MKPNYLIPLVVTLLLFTHKTMAQVWYFGENAGLDFNNDDVKVIHDGKLNTQEGCAVQCDAQGNLLFYTDGVNVYNSNHDLMEGGSGLGGHSSSTQSGIIVPQPQSASLFFVFSVDQIGENGGVQWAKIDISENGGLGKVISKGNQLSSKSAEKITAIRHENNTDYWVVYRDFDKNKFQAHLITKNGVSSTPVVTNTGKNYSATSLSQGYLKSNASGDLLAMADLVDEYWELLKFERSTGKLNSLMSFSGSDYNRAYGFEFSPSGKFLYMTCQGDASSRLYQFDLSSLNKGDVEASRKLVYQASGRYRLGALQIAPDGRIYCNQRGGAYVNSKYLAIIKNPDQPFPSCDFESNSIDLSPGRSWSGLPNVITSDYFSNPELIVEDVCLGDEATIKFEKDSYVDSAQVNFGDLSDATTTQSNLNKLYVNSGTFNVSVQFFLKNGDTIFKGQDIEVFDTALVSLPKDTAHCVSEPLILDVSCPGCSYWWSNGSTSSSITPDSPGVYHFEIVTSQGCISSGKIQVSFGQTVYSPIEDTTACSGDSIMLNPQLGETVLWNDGTSSQAKTVKESGSYSFVFSNDCGMIQDTIDVTFIDFNFTLPQDTVLCSTDSLVLDYSFMNNVSFSWSNGSSSPRNVIHGESQMVNVLVDSLGCVVEDSIEILFSQPLQTQIADSIFLCENEVYLLSSDNTFASLSINGQIVNEYEFSESGAYDVQIETPCGTFQKTVQVQSEKCQCLAFVPNAFSPNEDVINSSFIPVIDCQVEAYSFKVFNQWGELLFESSDQNESWTTDFPSSNVFIWVLEYKDPYSLKKERLKGTVTSLR